MVIVVYHLQSSRKHGGKLLFEKHLPRHPPDTCPDMKNRNLKSASVHHVDNNAVGGLMQLQVIFCTCVVRVCVVRQVRILGGDGEAGRQLPILA